MKKIIILFLALIMTVSLCTCGQKETKEPVKASEPPSQSSDVTETDSPADTAPAKPEVGQPQQIVIEVTPPEGWKPVEGSVLPVQYMKNTASFMVKQEQVTGDTLDAAIDETIKACGEAFGNLEVQGAVEDIIIDGYDSKKLTFTCVVSKMNMKMQYIYLFIGGKPYVIVFGDLADTFDSLSGDFSTILKNIKFKVQ